MVIEGAGSGQIFWDRDSPEFFRRSFAGIGRKMVGYLRSSSIVGPRRLLFARADCFSGRWRTASLLVSYRDRMVIDTLVGTARICRAARSKANVGRARF